MLIAKTATFSPDPAYRHLPEGRSSQESPSLSKAKEIGWVRGPHPERDWDFWKTSNEERIRLQNRDAHQAYLNLEPAGFIEKIQFSEFKVAILHDFIRLFWTATDRLWEQGTVLRPWTTMMTPAVLVMPHRGFVAAFSHTADAVLVRLMMD